MGKTTERRPNVQALLAPAFDATLSIEDLRADVRGTVIGPADADYEEARQVSIRPTSTGGPP